MFRKFILSNLAILCLVTFSTRAAILKDKSNISESRLSKQGMYSQALDRELSDRSDYSSIEKLNNEIEDLHNNIKHCFDAEFEASPAEIMAFTDILTKCVGENYSIVIQTYERILFQVKEITKERIKNSMREGFCDDILFMCIDFFRAIELFIELDYDITKSMEFNKKELERKISPVKLDYLLQISMDKLEDYDVIRENLVKEREFIVAYFKEKITTYKEQHQGDLSSVDEKDVDNV